MFVANKVEEWIAELESLSSFAQSQPHAAYAALTHGIMAKWNYVECSATGYQSGRIRVKHFEAFGACN